MQLYYAASFIKFFFYFCSKLGRRIRVLVFNLLQWLGDVETARVRIALMQEDLLQQLIPQLVNIQSQKKA